MRSREPLLHPASLLSMAVLFLNDHWWKDAWPSLVTGKVSDFAGLVFFPLLVEAFGIPRRAAVVLTAAGFTAVKVWPAANALWNTFFGAIYSAAGWADGASLVCDPTDLVALPMVLIPLFFMKQME
jgi:hypothetical protein